jgi:RNA recognition motif-containing protein
MINIFVAKLDYTISSDQLKQEFENFGRVNKATVAMDRETGKSRGFAFVEMADREEGEKAINALDGKSFNGRPIAVKEADDRGGNKRNKGAAPFKKPFEKKPGYRSDSSDKKRGTSLQSL